jgi:tRNA pseudouridine38-40 synthase
MTHWKLTLAYDGTPYHGWQVQPGLPTIQGTLADAIYRTMGERVLPQGSGRTDAGVHALAQVASFALDAAIPADNLLRALNRCLPPSIRILTAEIAPPNFHARHCAIRKTYEYRIFSLRQATTANVPHSSQSHRDEWVCHRGRAPHIRHLP